MKSDQQDVVKRNFGQLVKTMEFNQRKGTINCILNLEPFLEKEHCNGMIDTIENS